MVCCSTKAAISLKRVKIEEKLSWRVYRNSPTLFRTVPSTPPIRPPLPQDWGSQPPPKTPIAIISGTGKATNFKFGRVHPNKSPLKNLEKMERGHIQGLPKLFEYHLLSQESGTGKATNFKFCTHIHSIHGKKSPLTISGKVAVGIVRDSRKFPGQYYIGRIARSSLR